MNWTLDGLELYLVDRLSKTNVESHPWKGMFKDTKKKQRFKEERQMLEGFKGLRLTEKDGTKVKVWFVRYADDFLVGVNSE